MESLITYVIVSVIIIPLLTRIVWSNKKIRKFIGRVFLKLLHHFKFVQHSLSHHSLRKHSKI